MPTSAGLRFHVPGDSCGVSSGDTLHEIDYKTHLRKGARSYVEYLDVDRHMRATFMALYFYTVAR